MGIGGCRTSKGGKGSKKGRDEKGVGDAEPVKVERVLKGGR